MHNRKLFLKKQLTLTLILYSKYMLSIKITQYLFVLLCNKGTFK